MHEREYMFIKFKKFVSSLVVLVVMNQSLMAEDVSFFKQSDKQEHMALSAAVAMSVTGYARNQGYSKVESFFWGAGTTVGLGFIKEAMDKYDKNQNSTSSWNDIAADAIGATAGALISA